MLPSTLQISHPRFPHSFSLPLGWVRAELTKGEGASDAPTEFQPLSAVASVEAPVAFAVTVREAADGAEPRALLAKIAGREGFRIEAFEDVQLPVGPALRALARQGDAPDAASGWIVVFAAGGVTWSLIAIAPNDQLDAHREAFELLFLSFRLEFEASAVPQGPATEASEAAELMALDELPRDDAAPSAPPREAPAALEIADPVRRLDAEIAGPDAPICVRSAPDGSHLVFAVARGKGSEVWSGQAGTDRSNVRLLAIQHEIPRALRFAPGGRFLACDVGTELRVLDVARREVVFACTADAHAWQPPHRDRHLGGMPLGRETLWYHERGSDTWTRWESDLPGLTASGEVLDLAGATIDAIAPSPDGVQALFCMRRAAESSLVLVALGTPGARTLATLPGARRLHATWSEDGARIAVVVAADARHESELLVFESLLEPARRLAKLGKASRVGNAAWLAGSWLACARGDALTIVDTEQGEAFDTGVHLAGEGELSVLPGWRVLFEDGAKLSRVRFAGPFGTAPEELDDEEMPTLGIGPLPRDAWRDTVCAQGAAIVTLPPGWETDRAALGAGTAASLFSLVAAFAPRDRAATEAGITLHRAALPARGAIVDILAAAHEALGFRERMQRDHDGLLDTLGVRSQGDAFWRMRSLLREDGGELWLVVVTCRDEAWHEVKRTLAHALLSFRLARPRGATLPLHRESLRRDDPRYDPGASRR